MLPIAQAAVQAAEAGRSGISIFLDAGVVGLILTNSALLVKAMVDRKNVKKALNFEPERPCASHAERLVRLEASIVPDKAERLATLEANYLSTNKMLDDIRKENREDHHQIFAALEQLKRH